MLILPVACRAEGALGPRDAYSRLGGFWSILTPPGCGCSLACSIIRRFLGQVNSPFDRLAACLLHRLRMPGPQNRRVLFEHETDGLRLAAGERRAARPRIQPESGDFSDRDRVPKPHPPACGRESASRQTEARA